MSVNPRTLVARSRRGDTGAVAVVVAISALMLFGIGALAVDIGNAYARKRASQTTADLAALAGAAHLGVTGGVMEARKAAIDYIRNQNPVQSDDGTDVPDCLVTSATAPVCWDNDGNLDNGEISFTDDAGTSTTGIGATRIRVVTPRRDVKFGLGTALGYQDATVQKAATAGIFSPGGASAPPFYLTPADVGMTCIKDDSNGNGNPIALRAALLPTTAAPNDPTVASINPTSGPEYTATPVTITGTNFGTDRTKVNVTIAGQPATVTSTTDTTISATTPANVAQVANAPVIVDVKNKQATGTLTYTFTATPAPTVSTVNPTSGPEYTATGFTISGNGFGTNAGQVTVTFGSQPATITSVTNTQIVGSTPATVPAGPVPVVVSRNSSAAATQPTFTFTPRPKPTGIVLTPNIGPDTATNTVTITGTNLPSNPPAGWITFGGTPVQSVVTASPLTVRPPTGTAGTTVQVIVYNGSTPSDPVSYTYVSDPTTCPGTASNRGYIDEPRFDGNSQSVIKNIQSGIDHNMHTWQTYKLPANAAARDATPYILANTTCDNMPVGTIFKSGSSTPVPDINCVRLRTGTISSFEKGYFDATDGRMYQLDSGGSTGKIANYTGVDTDDLFDTRFVDAANMTAFKAAVLAGAKPLDAQKGWVKDAILKCPRFAILPVVNAPVNPPNGTTYYPIVGFKALFITSVAGDPSEHGFTFNGGSLRTVKGIVFDLDWLHANISSSAVIATQAYVGTGPVIAKLVRDKDDGTY